MTTTYKKDDEYLRIEQDENPESPREWDNVGTVAIWHPRYLLGDEQPKRPPDEFQEDLPEGTVVLPVYMIDHSGISLSTGAFGCPWDSGQVGIIYATPEVVEKEKIDKERVEEILRGEIETYNQFVMGDVYGFILYKMDVCENCSHAEEKTIDSCWGFYGDDHKASGLLDHAGVENLEEWEEQ